MLRTLFLRAEALVAYDHSKVLLPWFSYARARTPLARLRRHALELERPGACKPGLLTVAVAAPLHALRVLRESVLCLGRLGGKCRRHMGVGYLRQFFGCLHAGLRHNLGARLYYHFHLFARPSREWADFATHKETTLLLKELEQGSLETPRIWGKLEWASFCRAKGLVTLPILGTCGPEGVVLEKPIGELAGQDLFLKPDLDYSGRGGLLLSWQGAGLGWRAEGAVSERVPEAELGAFLSRVGRDVLHVIQPRARNHPSLAPLTPRALLNARVLTYRDASGQVSIATATLRCPPGDHVTSDVIGGTLQIPLNLETGRLENLHVRDFALSGGDRLPGTGFCYGGLHFPEWSEALELVRRAHHAVHWLPCLGWDLVATDQGNVLLEANIVWSGELAQQFGLRPLGTTGLPEALLSHLESMRSKAASTAAA